MIMGGIKHDVQSLKHHNKSIFYNELKIMNLYFTMIM